jgi:hypothetical protein
MVADLPVLEAAGAEDLAHTASMMAVSGRADQTVSPRGVGSGSDRQSVAKTVAKDW